MSNKGAGAVTDKGAQGLIPKLRFPEFRKTGEWEFKPLRKLAERQSNRNVGQAVTRVLTNSAEHGVVDQRDYFEKDIATQGNLDSYFVVNLGDYVYNPRVSNLAPVGPISKNKIGIGVMSPIYTVFRFNDQTDGFYENYFRSTYWHNYLRHASNSGARHDRMAISNDDFMLMPLPAPEPAEQKKVAECLSSLDALIAGETAKLATLRDYKKSLMQQLFPMEGENTPRLRFPEFRAAEPWKRLALSALLSEPKQRNRKLAYGPENVLSVSGEYGCVNQIGFLGRSYAGVSVKDYHIVEHGDVVYTKSPLKAYPFGIIKSNKGDAGIVSTLYAVYRPIKICNADFIDYYFSRPHFLNRYLQPIVKKGAKNDMKVNNSDVLSGDVWVPEKDEQQKIADFLLTVDNRVFVQIDRIAALRSHRDGLMQQIFPLRIAATA
jgi:type I restriction enzyme S subunit